MWCVLMGSVRVREGVREGLGMGWGVRAGEAWAATLIAMHAWTLLHIGIGPKGRTL